MAEIGFVEFSVDLIYISQNIDPHGMQSKAKEYISQNIDPLKMSIIAIAVSSMSRNEQCIIEKSRLISSYATYSAKTRNSYDLFMCF